jgi:hypothetical protein
MRDPIEPAPGARRAGGDHPAGGAFCRRVEGDGGARRLWPQVEIRLLSLRPRGEGEREMADEIAPTNALLAPGSGARPLRGQACGATGRGAQRSASRAANLFHMAKEGRRRMVAVLAARVSTISRWFLKTQVLLVEQQGSPSWRIALRLGLH